MLFITELCDYADRQTTELEKEAYYKVCIYNN